MPSAETTPDQILTQRMSGWTLEAQPDGRTFTRIKQGTRATVFPYPPSASLGLLSEIERRLNEFQWEIYLRNLAVLLKVNEVRDELEPLKRLVGAPPGNKAKALAYALYGIQLAPGYAWKPPRWTRAAVRPQLRVEELAARLDNVPRGTPVWIPGRHGGPITGTQTLWNGDELVAMIDFDPIPADSSLQA